MEDADWDRKGQGQRRGKALFFFFVGREYEDTDNDEVSGVSLQGRDRIRMTMYFVFQVLFFKKIQTSWPGNGHSFSFV